MTVKFSKEFIRKPTSKKERALWDRLSKGDKSVVGEIYDLTSLTYFGYIISVVKSQDVAAHILTKAFYAMLGTQNELSGTKLSRFLSDTVKRYTDNYFAVMVRMWYAEKEKSEKNFTQFLQSVLRDDVEQAYSISAQNIDK